jgi:glycosyltransferase involved in cell wall biosynthesis
MKEHRGVELVVLPTIRHKYLDTPVHTLFSCLHAFSRRYDAALLVNSANAVFVPLLRLAGTPVALNVDGLEKRRAKWSWPGRLVYALSERLATFLPNRLVTDAEVIQRYYLERYGVESTVIAYGVDPRPLPPGPRMEQLRLISRQYLLYVSRFEPENNPHVVAEAYRRVGGDLPLVMVGTAPYATEFIRRFTRDADARILFPGPIYGDGYRELLSHAFAYIHATDVGGTHPALVEAMGYGNCVVVNDTPENREVTAEGALYFRADEPDSLVAQLERLRQDTELAKSLRDQAAERALRLYSWEKIVGNYDQLFRDLARHRRRQI